MTEVHQLSSDHAGNVEKLLGTMFADPTGYDAGVARTVLHALADPRTFFAEDETRQPREVDIDEAVTNACGLQLFEDYRVPFLQQALGNMVLGEN